LALSDVDNAMRGVAKAWAHANGLEFVWDNSPALQPTGPTLEWAFRSSGSRRLTASTVRTTGVIEAGILVPVGEGLVGGLTRAASLKAAFLGGVFAGASVLDEIATTPSGRHQGTRYRIAVRIPWEFDERRVPQGVVGPHEAPGELAAYQAFRGRWEQEVRAPIALRTFFDNSPAVDDAVPPWALAVWRTLEPIPREMGTLHVPGRVIVALNFPAGSGVDAAEAAITTIVRAFDECSFRGLTFGTPVVTRVGRTPNETWQANVRLPFHYEVRP